MTGPEYQGSFTVCSVALSRSDSIARRSQAPSTHSDVMPLHSPCKIVCSSCAAAYFQQMLICGLHSLVQTLADADKRAYVRS